MDGITPEEILCGRRDMTTWMWKVCKKIWNSIVNPTDCKKGTIVKLPKKSDLLNCKNWWGITLLSIPGKVFTIFILQ